MAEGVTLERFKLDALIAATAKLKGKGVRFGYTGDDAATTPPLGDSGQTVATIMQLHEFGIGVPERSTVRATVAAKRTELAKASADGATAALKSGDPRDALKAVELISLMEFALSDHHAAAEMRSKLFAEPLFQRALEPKSTENGQ